jgi:hypothetical protein
VNTSVPDVPCLTFPLIAFQTLLKHISSNTSIDQLSNEAKYKYSNFYLQFFDQQFQLTPTMDIEQVWKQKLYPINGQYENEQHCAQWKQLLREQNFELKCTQNARQLVSENSTFDFDHWKYLFVYLLMTMKYFNVDRFQ